MTPPAKVNELEFDPEAILLALVVSSGLHEGRWTLGVAFHQSVERVEVGGKVTVGALAAFHSLRVTRLDDGVPVKEGVPVVDAAIVNPAPDGAATLAN